MWCVLIVRRFFYRVATVIPKGDTFRTVADYRADNQQIESVPWLQLRMEEAAGFPRSASCFRSFDVVPGCRPLPLHAASCQAFTMVTQEELVTPLRVPQVVLNATLHVQASIELQVPVGLIFGMCVAWVVDSIVWGRKLEELVNIGQVSGRFIVKAILAAANEVEFCSTSIKWCGKIYSAEGQCSVENTLENMHAIFVYAPLHLQKCGAQSVPSAQTLQ